MDVIIIIAIPSNLFGSNIRCTIQFGIPFTFYNIDSVILMFHYLCDLCASVLRRYFLFYGMCTCFLQKEGLSSFFQRKNKLMLNSCRFFTLSAVHKVIEYILFIFSCRYSLETLLLLEPHAMLGDGLVALHLNRNGTLINFWEVSEITL